MAKKQPKSANPRTLAVRLLTELYKDNRSLNLLLSQYLPQAIEKERGFLQQLCYEELRWHSQLSFIAKGLLSKPIRNKDTDIYLTLLLGILQLRIMKTPEHAAISESVNICKSLGKSWATGLINACLRNYIRQQDSLDIKLQQDPAALYSHPEWLLKQYQNDWPQSWQAIATANNQHPPMMLRLNLNKLSRNDYLAGLTKLNIKASAIETCDSAILLETPCDVTDLPEFSTGLVSVQDGAAQLASTILDIHPEQRVLDACAAPGGKTCHILELGPDNEVIALDIAEQRLQQVQQNLDRTKLSATTIAADARELDRWWDGKLFDRILIDAPCTGSGVIRRHPDIKALRRAEDIDSLAKQQQQLLDTLWPLLKPGGRMVYTTCSVFKQENEQQIEAFLERHTDAEEIKLTPPPAQSRRFGYQRLPGDDVMDGFYYVCLRHR